MLVIWPKVALGVIQRRGVVKLRMVERVEKLRAEHQRGILAESSHLGRLDQRHIPVELPGAKNDAHAAVSETGPVANHRRGTKCGCVEIARAAENTAPQPRCVRLPGVATFAFPIPAQNCAREVTGARAKAVDRPAPGIGNRKRRSVLSDGYSGQIPAIRQLAR